MSATDRMYPIRRMTSHFGVECLNVDLSEINIAQDERLIDQIKADLIEYRFVLFRRQKLSGQQQVDLSNALGKVESTFYKHPKSPHPDVFRVSNDEEEGCTNVGRSGWHIDGTFQLRPFSYQTMYFPSVVEGGDTYFIPLKELYESFSPEEQDEYNHLWMATGRRQAPVHPLVCLHPFRPNNEPTMIFHCGKPFVKGWFRDIALNCERENSIIYQVNMDYMIPAQVVQRQLTNAIENNVDRLGLKMKWEEGDFMINDNLGLAHFASDGTQVCHKSNGLRILHRTTIVGGNITIPKKTDGRQSFMRSN